MEVVIFKCVMALVAFGLSGFAWFCWFVMAPGMMEEPRARDDYAVYLIFRFFGMLMAGCGLCIWWLVFAA